MLMEGMGMEGYKQEIEAGKILKSMSEVPICLSERERERETLAMEWWHGFLTDIPQWELSFTAAPLGSAYLF